jgi:hypothetical protein
VGEFKRHDERVMPAPSQSTLLTGWLFCTIPAWAGATAPASMICPPSLTVTQKIDAAAGDWLAFSSHERHPWTGVSFSEGPPDQMVWLAPTEEHAVRGIKVATRRFLPSAQGYWVACIYSGSSAYVARKLPAELSFCEVEFDPKFAAAEVSKWRCVSPK